MAWVVWYLPGLLLVAGMFWSKGRLRLWTPALLLAGLACVVNAARCGRLHCYLTGPLYLLGAAYVVLAQWKVLPLRPFWFLTVLVTASFFSQLAETPLGKYARKRPRPSGY